MAADEPTQRAVDAVELELMRTPVVKRLKAGRRVEIARRIVGVLQDLDLLMTTSASEKPEPRSDG